MRHVEEREFHPPDDTHLLPGILTLLATLIRLINLDLNSLWLDEGSGRDVITRTWFQLSGFTYITSAGIFGLLLVGSFFLYRKDDVSAVTVAGTFIFAFIVSVIVAPPSTWSRSLLMCSRSGLSELAHRISLPPSTARSISRIAINPIPHHKSDV